MIDDGDYIYIWVWTLTSEGENVALSMYLCVFGGGVWTFVEKGGDDKIKKGFSEGFGFYLFRVWWNNLFIGVSMFKAKEEEQRGKAKKEKE